MQAGGRVTRVANELGEPVTYTYDRLGRRLTLTDAEGNTTRYAYDAAGQLTAMIYPHSSGDTKLSLT